MLRFSTEQYGGYHTSQHATSTNLALLIFKTISALKSVEMSNETVLTFSLLSHLKYGQSSCTVRLCMNLLQQNMSTVILC